MTWGGLRSPRFRRLHHDVYVLAEAPVGLDQAVRAALVRHPDGVIVGLTAAALWGALDERLGSRLGPVEVAVPGGARPAGCLRVCRDRLAPGEITELHGVRLSTPVRTALDATRRLGTVDAVVVVEALVRSRGVTVEDVRAAAGDHERERGLARTRVALAHVEEEARAGVETRVRMALLVAGLPRPVVGHVVLHAAVRLHS